MSGAVSWHMTPPRALTAPRHATGGTPVMRIAFIAAVFLACHPRAIPVDRSIVFPRGAEETHVDLATLQAIQAATDAFLPANPWWWLWASDVDRCIWSPRGLDYYITQTPELIFVRVQLNPAHCGTYRTISHAAARFAVRRADGQIVHYLRDAEPAALPEAEKGQGEGSAQPAAIPPDVDPPRPPTSEEARDTPDALKTE